MTPAVRAAQAAKLAFTLHRYEHDAGADSFGLEAAAKLNVPPERVFKTLVAQIDGKQLVLAEPGFRGYSLVLPPDLPPGPLVIDLRPDTFSPRGEGRSSDPRELGIQLDRLRVE